jgi:hypothetical protein
MYKHLSYLDKYVMAVTLGGDDKAESELVAHFYEILQDHPRPIVVSIVNAAESKDISVEELRAAVLDTCRLILRAYCRVDSSANLASAPPPEPSLLDRTCTAIMSFLLTTCSKPLADAGSGHGRACTNEQQSAYIDRLKAQSKG